MHPMFKPLLLVLITGLTALGCSSDDGQQGNGLVPTNTSDTTDGNGGDDTGNSTPGDTSTPPPAGNDGTIQSLQLQAEDAGCTEDGGFPATVAEGVIVTTAIVTSPRFVADDDGNDNPVLDGYYVWDGDQALWSGILLTIPSSENTNFKPGDTLVLQGDLKEAWCNTQLSIEANGYEHTGSGDAPEPLGIDTTTTDFEPYEGMLVSVSDVLVESETTWGGYVLEGGLEVSYGFGFYLSMEVGKRYDIVGQVMYSYSAYKLLPRTEADFHITGEEPTTPPGDPVDPETLDGTIKGLQQAAEAAGCSEDVSFPTTQADSVSVASAVVTSPRMEISDDLHGYYIWDNDQAPWSGILLTIPTSENSNFQLGDVLSLTGELEDAWCNTQLSVEAGGWELTGATTVSDPVAIEADLEDVEPYEGMLVSLSNVLVEAEAGGGRYTLEGGLEVDYGFDFFLTMTVGARYDLVGQIKYGYSLYKIIPRYPEDLVVVSEGTGPGPDPGPSGDTTITAIQESSDSLECANTGGIETIGTNLVFEGTVTVESFYVHATLNGYILSDGSQNAHSSIAVVVSPQSDQNWTTGQRLRVTGDHIEFYCMTEFQATTVEVLEGESTVAPPLVVTDFSTNSEAYEGMLVTVENVTVTSIEEFSSYGQFETDGGFLIGSWLVAEGELTEPAVDDVYCSVTGVVSYSFGSFRVNPRTAADLAPCTE